MISQIQRSAASGVRIFGRVPAEAVVAGSLGQEAAGPDRLIATGKTRSRRAAHLTRDETVAIISDADPHDELRIRTVHARPRVRSGQRFDLVDGS